MNPFQMFMSPMFGNVRAAIIDGVVWFVGVDIAKALGYVRADMTIKRHVEEKDKRISLVPTFCYHKKELKQSGSRNMIIINESGLYTLILASHAPQAQEFKRWVTAEVLPTIRRTGSYDLLEGLPVPTSAPAETEAVQEPIAPSAAQVENAVLISRIKKQFGKPCVELAIVYMLLLSNLTVKIGYTSNPTERFKKIKSETRLDVIDFYSSRLMPLEEARALEAALKEKYAADCLGGEYFDIKFVDAARDL